MTNHENEHQDYESMDYDVVIVGGGPAGLAAALRLKQRAADLGQDISVALLEKGSEIGAHILSGAVMDPRALDELMPDWREQSSPLETPVTQDHFLMLGPSGSFSIPLFLLPGFMKNKACYIVSLGDVCRWLAEKAEALGVEIYPGFPAAKPFIEDGCVKGVFTGAMGVGRDGQPKEGMYQPPMLLKAKYTLVAEGARGSLSKILIDQYKLDEGSEPQKYGIGLKELWRLAPEKHTSGLVQHSFGWPLKGATGGGSFVYHFTSKGERYASLGFVVHLNYKNPYLSPFGEFQRFKTHPIMQDMLEGGERLSYGARAITEGGLQSVPQLIFPGGALVGCAAGFVNLPRIKGSHNAMKTGMLAADAAFEALEGGRTHDMLETYETSYRQSWVYEDLKPVRNVKPLWSKFGLWGGVLLGGFDMWMHEIFGFSFFGTLKHGKSDAACTEPKEKHRPIDYPKPDGVTTFDRLSSVFVSNTSHEEDQPVHLRLQNPDIPVEVNLPRYDEPAQRYCPAAVYEIVHEGEGKTPRFQINAANCVHCKTCDIKDPAQNITWDPPEGGGGPRYPNM